MHDNHLRRDGSSEEKDGQRPARSVLEGVGQRKAAGGSQIPPRWWRDIPSSGGNPRFPQGSVGDALDYRCRPQAQWSRNGRHAQRGIDGCVQQYRHCVQEKGRHPQDGGGEQSFRALSLVVFQIR